MFHIKILRQCNGMHILPDVFKNHVRVKILSGVSPPLVLKKGNFIPELLAFDRYSASFPPPEPPTQIFFYFIFLFSTFFFIFLLCLTVTLPSIKLL